MTLTFDREKYQKLLCQYQPKVIKNEAENTAALKVIEQLMHSENRTPEEDELYELLVILVENFEREYYQPGATSTPHSMLHFLMEQQRVEQNDLVKILGHKDIVVKIINGQQEIGKDHAKALSDFFNVDAELFS